MRKIGELKIRVVKSSDCTCSNLVCIDRFDNLDPIYASKHGEEYYCSATIIDNHDSIKPIDQQHLGFSRESGFSSCPTGDGYGVDSGDIFSFPTPQMYNELGRILKAKGLVFNKKKCRFQVIDQERLKA